MLFSLEDKQENWDLEAEERVPEIKLKQRRKEDARDLALLVYDLYQESQSNDRIMENKRSGNE
jgi:hypothetical protein